MAKERNKNNIFDSFIASEIFDMDVIEKIFTDLKESYGELTFEEYKDKICEYIGEHFDEWAIDQFLNEEFEGLEDE